MANSLVTLTNVKTALDIDHDDHDEILQSQIDAGVFAAFSFLGNGWYAVITALPTIREAITAYVRALYNDEAEALLTDPQRMHLFYRLLKPLTAQSLPNATLTEQELVQQLAARVTALEARVTELESDD